MFDILENCTHMKIAKRETTQCYKKGFDYSHYPIWVKTKTEKLRPIIRFFVQTVQIKGFYKFITKQIYKLYTQNTSIKRY